MHQLREHDQIDRVFEIEVDGQRYPLERVCSPHNHQLEQNFSFVAVAMVKNEVDIIQAWLAHIYSLFDRIYILDHNSIDGTYSYLLKEARSQAKLQIFTFAHPGMVQAEIINCLIKIAAWKTQRHGFLLLMRMNFSGLRAKNAFLPG